MKQSEILGRVLKGELIQCGEYLMSRSETIKYSKNGKADQFDKLTHTVLTTEGAVSVDEDTRKLPGFSAETYKSPFKKGQTVAIVVTSKTSLKGVVTIRGAISIVEA